MALNEMHNQLSQSTHATGVGVIHDRLVELLDAGEHAVALIDLTADRIAWCSSVWLATLPDWCVGLSWTQLTTQSSTVTNLYNALASQKQVSGTLMNPQSGEMLDVHLFRLSDGWLALRASAKLDVVDKLHLYMQAREHMFTTSRTISVSEMATTLAHEIKQPIATISNLLKGVRLRLKRSDVSVDILDEAIVKALEQADFTNSIINRIRDFTQARRPKQQVVDLVTLTREAMSLMDWFLRANSCSIDLTVTHENVPLYCKGDATMLQQVLVNLLKNGVEAMQECDESQRNLEVICKTRGDFVRVSITDNGHGLESGDQSVFLPFTTSKANGMGVGLNICRSFVELHQGRLWLSPNSDGGCTSHIELPVVSDTEIDSVQQTTEVT